MGVPASRETARLIMRPFQESDFTTVHSYASSDENTKYMFFGPNSEEETRAFLTRVIASYDQTPITNYEYAVVEKETGTQIGGFSLQAEGDTGEVGWILHQDHHRKGYATEAARELLALGFEELDLRRIRATCHSENQGSRRLMEKMGMRLEATFQDVRKSKPTQSHFREYHDENHYGILREEWEIQKEIAYYNALPCHFTGFTEIPQLADGEIHLICIKKNEAVPEKKYVPDYNFIICKDNEKIGTVNLRIGYTDQLYYSGQVGYAVDEAHRGHNYAVKATRLLAPIARAHGMTNLLITNNHTNTASRRVCEKLGAKLVRLARLPEWSELYKQGQRFVNIYDWSI